MLYKYRMKCITEIYRLPLFTHDVCNPSMQHQHWCFITAPVVLSSRTPGLLGTLLQPSSHPTPKPVHKLKLWSTSATLQKKQHHSKHILFNIQTMRLSTSIPGYVSVSAFVSSPMEANTSASLKKKTCNVFPLPSPDNN